MKKFKRKSRIWSKRKKKSKGADFFLTFAFLNKLENPFFFPSSLETLFYT